ncbi:hypothetical protein PGT21_021693 [Puccinia graminis f. sp. tritici]|uniref:Uncharacterized protein n=1 Tax=Puccinia graminis f. sp. tritici TaxID=56615 RepID=A0A5B0NWW2_PUCGR|nr:hypothetical protein PGT21_021693 [Puccinia graminis f. sp. tritici]
MEKSSEKVQIGLILLGHIFELDEIDESNNRFLIQWVLDNVAAGLEQMECFNLIVGGFDLFRSRWACWFLMAINWDGWIEIEFFIFDSPPIDEIDKSID